jgi:hypothetical protein
MFKILIRSLFNNYMDNPAVKDTITASCKRKLGNPAIACKTVIGTRSKSIAIPDGLYRQERRR